MPNYEQAPVLINKKPPGRGNFLQIDSTIYAAVCKGVGRKYKAGLLMLWYIGQADGFRIPAKTVMDVFGFKRKDDYYSTRRDLVDLGFIDVIDTDTIRINYNTILKGQEKTDPIFLKGQEKPDPTVRMGRENADPILLMGQEKTDPIFLKGQENPDPMKGQEKPDPKNRVRKNRLKGQENPDPMGQENPDYNIEGQRINKEGFFDVSTFVDENGNFVF